MWTKTGKRWWCAKDRNYLITDLFNDYHVDPNTGVSYHVVDAGNIDYGNKVYNSHPCLFHGKTEQYYFNNHLIWKLGL